MKSRNSIEIPNIPSLYHQPTSSITITNSISHRTKANRAKGKIFTTELPNAIRLKHKTVHSFLSQAIPQFHTIKTQRLQYDNTDNKPITISTLNTKKTLTIADYKLYDNNSHRNPTHTKRSSVFPEYNVLTRISQDFITDKTRNDNKDKQSITKKANQWRIKLFASKIKQSPFYSPHSNLTTARSNTMKLKLKTKRKIEDSTHTHKPSLTPFFTEKRKRKLELDHLELIQRQKEDYSTKVTNYLNAEFLPLQDTMTKHNSKQIESLRHEIEFKRHEDFEIINPKMFSSDYRFTFELIPPKKRTSTLNKPIIQRIAKHYNLNHLLEDYALSKEVKKTVDVIIEDEKLKHNRLLIEKWKKVIIKSAIHFQRLNIPLIDFYSMKKFNIKPYEHEKTYLFFQAIKDDDIERVMIMLESNKSLAYDFDHFHQTMLHWMAKRNRYKMISFAVKRGANINAEDIAGRTPLHVAVLMNNIEAVMILLYELSNPFAIDKDGKRPIDLTVNLTVKFILKRVVLLYYIHTIGKTKLFESNIRRGLAFLYQNELRLSFNQLKFNY